MKNTKKDGVTREIIDSDPIRRNLLAIEERSSTIPSSLEMEGKKDRKEKKRNAKKEYSVIRYNYRSFLAQKRQKKASKEKWE